MILLFTLQYTNPVIYHSYKLTASLGFKSGNELDYFSATDLGLPSGDLGLAGGKGHFLSTHVHMFTIICMCINFLFSVGVCDFFFYQRSDILCTGKYSPPFYFRPFLPSLLAGELKTGQIPMFQGISLVYNRVCAN